MHQKKNPKFNYGIIIVIPTLSNIKNKKISSCPTQLAYDI
jgi:hypothetical protein